MPKAHDALTDHTIDLEALPPAVTEPVGRLPDALRLVRGRCKTLVARELGDEAYFVYVRSRSRVDVGGWLGRPRVHVFALAGAVLLIANDPIIDWGRAYVRRAGYETLSRSMYNHVTGALALADASGRLVSELRMGPLDAAQLLAQIHQKELAHV